MTFPVGDSEGETPDEEIAVEGEETLAADEELALDDGEEGLPWLEDDEYYEDEGGFDTRMIWFALLGCLAIAAILLAAWWFTRDRPDPELAADGSTIEAPDGPYKERPADPGGREVAGTGDTAFEVAEGESTRGRIGDGTDSDSAQPSIDTTQGSADGAAESDNPDAAYVQIGAFTSRADANTAWSSATGRYSALSGMRHRIVEAEVNGARVYRLQAIAANREAGESACRAIRNAGGDCYLR